MDLEQGNRILALRERIVSNFGEENWEEVGLLTGSSEIIHGHSRLLRSLSWGDEDYSGNVLNVLTKIASQDEEFLDVIEGYLSSKFEDETHYVSAKPSVAKITFAPNVFDVPEPLQDSDLVSVMMPFLSDLDPVYQAVRGACARTGYRALRADDIWETSTIIQDIFNLIFRSSIVIVDFTGKNPNVMYETGIAHTLGKLVIPISQSLEDIPFDMKHHRALKYLANGEGLTALEEGLVRKLERTKDG